MVEPPIGVELIIALGIAIVSIIIAVGIVTKQVPVLEGTQLLTALLGGGILIRVILARKSVQNA